MNGKNITYLRKKQMITQEELAHILGITNITLSRWENGHFEPNATSIKKLCEALHCTESELLNGQPDSKVRITLSYDLNKMKEGEIDMETSGFDLFLGKNGFIGLRGGVMLSAERTIDDVIAEIRKELERGLATQIERGTIQKA